MTPTDLRSVGVFLCSGTRRMKIQHLAITLLLGVTLSSCGGNKEPERKPVPPTSENSQIPWNQPIPGQGGGALGMLPQQGRR
jgi:hypothetical protein